MDGPVTKERLSRNENLLRLWIRRTGSLSGSGSVAQREERDDVEGGSSGSG